MKFLHIALLALLAPACSSLGPNRIPPDQFNYNQAIGQGSNEQMLLNLIRLRYRDVPVFLAVNSVLTQYIYSGAAGVNGSMGTSAGEDANSLGASAGLLYIERPTITYSPLSGEKFADQLMTPIPGELIFSLLTSGWPAIDLLAMGMERVGDRRNPLFPGLLSRTGQEQSREFREVAGLMIEVAQRDGMEMLRGAGGDDSAVSFLVFQESADPETAALIEELKSTLGLSPEIWKFRVTPNVIERGEKDVTIRVRSLLDLMGYLSGGVQIPQDHFDRLIGRPTAEQQIASELVPLRIQSGPELPEDVFVGVNYLDRWFWIDAADDQSKESFGLLTYLFLMMAPRPEGSGPLLTVPTG